ncbi:MAG: hypothetical protein M1275_00960 [Patescibacteria group bacterium]|nr:hypothetical protein [Patescibacteria group bacterium]
MPSDKLAPYFLIALGAALIVISFPNIRRQTVGRLQDSEILPKINLKPRDQEILSGAGPDLSLLILGVALVALGVIEIIFS